MSDPMYDSLAERLVAQKLILLCAGVFVSPARRQSMFFIPFIFISDFVCVQSSLVVESKFPLKFPDYERKILDYTVHTNGERPAPYLSQLFNTYSYYVVGGWAHGHPSSSKFYWASDVDDIGHQIARLNNDVHMRKPGASKALSNFYTARLALVEHVVQVVSLIDTHDIY